MKNILNLLTGIFLGAGIMCWIIRLQINELRTLREVNQIHNTNNLRMTGGTYLRGCNLNYDLRSWDAGKSWYAVDYNLDTKQLKILGEAEEIYPGLIEQLNAMDKLKEYIEKNGPVDFENPMEAKLLENAGFKIQK